MNRAHISRNGWHINRSTALLSSTWFSILAMQVGILSMITRQMWLITVAYAVIGVATVMLVLALASAVHEYLNSRQQRRKPR